MNGLPEFLDEEDVRMWAESPETLEGPTPIAVYVARRLREAMGFEVAMRCLGPEVVVKLGIDAPKALGLVTRSVQRAAKQPAAGPHADYRAALLADKHYVNSVPAKEGGQP